LHAIEGVGGLVITRVAYLVNPSPEGSWFGRLRIPSKFAANAAKQDFSSRKACFTQAQ
jgi:hypothetical protein